jgi:branched-chain amino acid transport system substrate-binding protein
MHHRASRRGLGAALAIVLVAALLGACSSDKKTAGANGSGGSGASSAAKPEDVLGPEHKATGPKIKIGLVSDGKSDAIDNTPELQAAKAAQQYLNTYLNGLNGNEIDLVTCETGQTPSGATDCATKMVDAKVAAVLVGVSGQSGSIFNGLAASGIPFFTYGNIDQDVLTKPNSFVVTNGLAAIAGPIAIAQAKGLTKAAVVVTDVPAASGPVNAVGPLFYKNGGVDLQVVPISPSVADMTPQLQTAIGNGAQQFAFIGTSSFCASGAKALKTLGFNGPIVLIPQCIDAAEASSIPGGYGGMIVVTSTTDDPNDADFKTYSAVMDKFASGTTKGGVAPGGYIVMLAFQRALAGLSGELTPASITATLSAMSAPVPIPLGGGLTFQCGTKPVAITPNVCAAKALQADTNEDGTGKNYTQIDVAQFTKL